MRYADCPTTESDAVVAAAPEQLWPLVVDQEWLADVSEELQRVEWLDGATGAGPGVRFRGHSAHRAIGEWSTVCTVTTWEPGQCVRWTVGADEPGGAGRGVGVRSRPGRRRHPRAAVGPAGSGPVRTHGRDRAVAGQGGADRRRPPRGVAGGHGAQSRRAPLGGGGGLRVRPDDADERAVRSGLWSDRDMLPGLDTLLDRTIAPGYSKLGYLARRGSWTGDRADPAPGALTGRVALVTGASSGLGEATAAGLAGLGAQVHLLVRNAEKGEQSRARIAEQVPGASLTVEICDVGELADVRRFAREFTARVPELDVLVHNAGLLPSKRSETSDGNEMTLAVHVLGPHLLTGLLADALKAGAARSGTDSRVLFVASGGMYAQPLKVDDLQFVDGTYGGTAAYARTKRMQVVLTGLWARELAGSGVTVHALHPGWAATPGVTGSIPAFNAVVGPALRTVEQGADTAVWLAAAPSSAVGTGRFWHDRAPRPAHYVPWTRETGADQERFWEKVNALAPALV